MVHEEESLVSKLLVLPSIEKTKKPSVSKSNCRSRTGIIICSALLALSSLVIVVILWFQPLELLYEKVLALYDDGFLFNYWRDPPIPAMVLVYPFNYTNVEAVLAGKERPHVQELGPYVYREGVHRALTEFTGLDYISFRMNLTHTFLPEASNGSLDDIIYTPNLLTLAALARTENTKMQSYSLRLLNRMMAPKAFLQITVDNLLWDYGDRFSGFLKTVSGVNQFGLLTNRAGLNEDTVTMGTGLRNKSQFSIISEWSGEKELDAYKADECNRIDGSDGGFYPRQSVGPNKTVFVFNKSACRRLPLVFRRPAQTKHDIPGYLYEMPNNVFDPPEMNKDNWCYCSHDCPPRGVLSLAPCFSGVPLVCTFPHFTHADESLLDKVTGLTPDPDKYSTWTIIHRLGVTVTGSSRLQLGLRIKDPSKIYQLRNLSPDTILPVAWIELKVGDLTPFVLKLFYIASYVLPAMQETTLYTSIAVSVLTSIWLCTLLKRKENLIVLETVK